MKPMYFAETREGHLKTLPFNCGLRKARKIAQELANDWEATVHLTVRVGYGASKYVSGQALYYPELSHNRWCSCVDCTGGTL